MRRFHPAIPQGALDDLRQRLERTRRPDQPAEVGWERGVPVDCLKDLAGYWRSNTDWRSAEANLNPITQFTTNINCANAHFLHVRSPEPDAQPLLIMHSWPSSVAEFLDEVSRSPISTLKAATSGRLSRGRPVPPGFGAGAVRAGRAVLRPRAAVPPRDSNHMRRAG